ncbi:MAG TPA: sugar phosphate isomerase/epimerase family protein [Opitutaceae bacterium]|jgi:sugar phosphate isomerase/epimerase
MSVAAPKDFSRLCVHTITTKPWSIEQAVRKYAVAGIGGITVWRNALDGRDVPAVGRMIRESGLSVVSLCRGGFFPGVLPADRTTAIDENRRCIDEAAALGAPMIVLVCGAVPGQPLEISRQQIAEGIAAVLPHAAAVGIRLAIEPLHPMYADTRSAINTISQARAVCAEIRSPWLGVAIDVYHVWWDDRLESEIASCGVEGTLFAFHICDWKTPTLEMLNDRGLMGEGCIPIRQIRGWVEAAGFKGFNEVEIFSEIRWKGDQDRFLSEIQQAYLRHS